MNAKENYKEKLRDPRWQKKRLEIMQRDGWKCLACDCESEELNIHHIRYKGEPWEAENSDLETVCCHCHKMIYEFEKEFGAYLPEQFKRQTGSVSKRMIILRFTVNKMASLEMQEEIEAGLDMTELERFKKPRKWLNRIMAICFGQQLDDFGFEHVMINTSEPGPMSK